MTASPPDSALDETPETIAPALSSAAATATTPKKKAKHHHRRAVRDEGAADDVPPMLVHSRSSGDIAALATGRVNVRRRRRNRKDSATADLLVRRI
jgi:hypothetical protein